MLRQEYIPAPDDTGTETGTGTATHTEAGTGTTTQARQASAGSIPYRASAGATAADRSDALKSGAAIGAGIGIALLGAFGAYQFYKHDQLPAAIITGVGALALGPRIASVII